MNSIFNDKVTHLDAACITRLYREHWKSMYNVAYRVLKDKPMCEDIIQDVFINVWNKRDVIIINESIKAYLLTSVRYEVLRRIRKEKKFEPIADSMAELYYDNSLSELIDYKDRLSDIQKRVLKLPEKCREVYILSRVEYLNHKQISVRLSISTKTVRNHLTRALRQLRTDSTVLMIINLISLFCHKL